MGESGATGRAGTTDPVRGGRDPRDADDGRGDDDETDGIDLAVVAYREEGAWIVADVDPERVDTFDKLVAELRRFPGETGTLGLLAVDEDFCLVVRVQGGRVRALLSDVTAAHDWDLASDAVDSMEVPLPEDDDEGAPAGDLSLLADLGLHPLDLAVLLDDDELYPDEVLSDIADRLGFGAVFDDLAGLAPA